MAGSPATVLRPETFVCLDHRRLGTRGEAMSTVIPALVATLAALGGVARAEPAAPASYTANWPAVDAGDHITLQ